MTWPQPTREDHDAFCRVEGWRRVRDARGRSGTHHVTCEIDESAFWSCVRDRVKPDRGAPSVPEGALPADLVHLLISRVGLDESEVAGMDKEEAVARVQRYWIEGC